MPKCPECNYLETWKSGFRYIQGNAIQRFICRGCGFRFSDPSFARKNILNRKQQNTCYQTCVTKTKVAKNLVAEQKESVLREMKQNTKGQIVSFAWDLKNLEKPNQP